MTAPQEAPPITGVALPALQAAIRADLDRQCEGLCPDGTHGDIAAGSWSAVQQLVRELLADKVIETVRDFGAATTGSIGEVVASFERLQAERGQPTAYERQKARRGA